jgi:SNF2 family DNA or RNA helicase
MESQGWCEWEYQGANQVVIFDFEYVPMEEHHAIRRAYRTGQDKRVFGYWLIVGGTFAESTQNRSVFKMQLQSRVVDQKNPLPWAQRKKTLRAWGGERWDGMLIGSTMRLYKRACSSC